MPCSGLVCALHVHSVPVCCCVVFAMEGLSEMNLNFEALRNLMMKLPTHVPLTFFVLLRKFNTCCRN